VKRNEMCFDPKLIWIVTVHWLHL